MRTYGRITDTLTKVKSWVVVTTDPQGFDDAVWVTTLAQCLKLSLGESPFYADYGIPAQPSVVQQIFPDFDVIKTQTQFAPHFANIIISPIPDTKPAYRVDVTTQQGYRHTFPVVPT